MWRPGEMEVRVGISSPEHVMRLSALNLNGDIYTTGGYAVLYLIPGELELLRREGFEYEVVKNDLNSYFEDFWENRDAYHTYEEIIQVMNTLSFGYPSICKKYDLGLSVEGRLLSALKISDNAASDENEPEVMFDGGIHGDEIGGAENLIRFAEFLCGNYGTNPDITDLIDNREIWLYVMVNPDGRVNMVRYNSNGIDINRDWGYMWNEEGGSPFYFSQVETRILRDCLYDNQFVVHTSYHSGTEFVSYPWSYRPDACPDQSHIDNLAEIYATTSGYSYMPFGQGYQGMYPINGSSKDSYYGIMGSVGWSIEISMDKQPPTTQIQYYYELNEPAMLAMIEHSGYGISGTVTDAVTGEPVAATIFIENYFPCYADPEVGDYHKYLLAGTYEVKAVANGYQAITQNATVANLGNTTLNFELQPEYNHYGYRIPACFIPDNNFDDEGITFAALWEPDNIHYSIGRSGWVIVDMGDTIMDGPGSEIRVYENDNDPEGYSCYAGQSIDGPWVFLGNATGSASFNFTPSGVQQARYIRIDDDGNGSASGNNAGFDLDAVEALEQPQVIYLVADAWISDPLGNNNNRIDPGENCDLMVLLRNNGGLTAQNLTVNVNYDSTHVTLRRTDTIAGDLSHGQEVVLDFPLTCSMLTPMEELVMMVVNVSANEGGFNQSFPVHFTVGAIVEDWETAGFEKFDWSSAGAKTWAINFIDPYEGAYSAKSGNIDDGQLSYLSVTFDVTGYDDISFYRKVSSENGNDFLKFYIDNTLVDQWSGNLDWAGVSYDVEPGFHTFKWSYEKNESISQGYDGGWIDYIVFPSSNLTGELKTLANALPHEFCEEGSAQLGAFVTGGSGNKTYAWTPPETLNNPASQFPTATLSETTVYSVEVNDGQSMAYSAIKVTVNPSPETPVVAQQGDSLLSSAGSGNQWYDSNGPIEGATGQVYYPDVEDYYHVMVTGPGGCISEPSEPVYFIFTGVNEEVKSASWNVYPNPAGEMIYVQNNGPIIEKVRIFISDLTGRVVLSGAYDPNGLIKISTSDLPRGGYILKVLNDEMECLHQQKLIK